MAATMKDPRMFFVQGSVSQYEFVLGLYEEAVKLKAKQKNKNVEELLKLDKWYQNELPKRIKSRGKDTHLTHEELCKCMRWKLYRGKFSPRLKDLIQMNTPRVCMTETKKAFRALLKKDDLSSAIQALCNLKGVGPAMASVILTAASPETCGFMADECLLAIPEIETIDYTTRELLNFVEQLKLGAERLNNEGGNGSWSCHKVEQALWAYFVVSDLDKGLLEGMPDGSVKPAAVAADTPKATENGTADANDDNSIKNNGTPSSSVSEENTDSLDSTGPPTDAMPDLPPSAASNGSTEDTSAAEDSMDVPEASNNGGDDDDDNSRLSGDEPLTKKLKLNDSCE